MDELLNTLEPRFDKQSTCLLEDSPFYLAHVQETETPLYSEVFPRNRTSLWVEVPPPHQDIHKTIDQLTEVRQCGKVSKILLLSFYDVQTFFILLPCGRTHPVAGNDLSTVVEECAGTELLGSLIETDAVPDINQ